ncbi:MAG TPA: transcription antitermination factor NusB [Bryobacteraceae bacterium]|nr:transcription antitermination factor NusB [Bryobacteraceae bacterium]
MSPARETAFHILERVHGGGYAADLLLREAAPFEARDAALAETLVFGCLRFQAQLDYLIELFSGRKQPKLDEEVRIALRLGIYQLRYLDRIPAHAAVTESVDLVKRAHKRSAAGFVNAVLRKVHRNPVTWPDQATELSIPRWMLERWQRHFGADQAAAIARAALAEPETTINPVTGRSQDIGSRFIVPLLEIEPGMLLLDLCAAPGNKTAQAIAAGARVVACDRYLRRLREVPDAAMRVALDASAPLPFATKFDRILVDAPCTGTGTLARNPEIKWRLRPADIDRLAALQRSILPRALEHLKPAGRLVYSTCSLEPEENKAIAAALPPGFKLLSTQLHLPGREAGDGFFAAVIASP